MKFPHSTYFGPNQLVEERRQNEFGHAYRSITLKPLEQIPCNSNVIERVLSEANDKLDRATQEKSLAERIEHLQDAMKLLIQVHFIFEGIPAATYRTINVIFSKAHRRFMQCFQEVAPHNGSSLIYNGTRSGASEVVAKTDLSHTLAEIDRQIDAEPDDGLVFIDGEEAALPMEELVDGEGDQESTIAPMEITVDYDSRADNSNGWDDVTEQMLFDLMAFEEQNAAGDAREELEYAKRELRIICLIQDRREKEVRLNSGRDEQRLLATQAAKNMENQTSSTTNTSPG